MTREEAITTLGNFKRYISGGGVTDLKANEAIDIAIEALSTDAEYAGFPDVPRAYYEKVVGNMAREINRLKEQLESAEAVEVVRCKECKHKYVSDNGTTQYYVCDFMDAQYKENGFCHHAEREVKE